MEATRTQPRRNDTTAEQTRPAVQPAVEPVREVPLDRVLQSIRSDSRRDPEAYLDSMIVWSQGE